MDIGDLIRVQGNNQISDSPVITLSCLEERKLPCLVLCSRRLPGSPFLAVPPDAFPGTDPDQCPGPEPKNIPSVARTP